MERAVTDWTVGAAYQRGLGRSRDFLGPFAHVFWQIDKRGKCEYNDTNKPPWRNWHTRQVEDLCPQGRGGSNPLGGTSRLTQRPRSNSWASSFSALFRSRLVGLLLGKGKAAAGGMIGYQQEERGHKKDDRHRQCHAQQAQHEQRDSQGH
jgi:hypothetical protein